MATLCSHHHLTSRAPHNGIVSSPTSSSMHLRSVCSSAHHLLHLQPKLAFSLLKTSTSCIAGNSSYALLQPPQHVSRVMRRSEPGMVGVIKAALLFEWIGKVISFFTKAPIKLFAQKVEADLDRAAKMVKTGASLVARIAKEADEFAEEVERVAEQTEEVANKVAKATDTIEERIDEILDVIEGEKKLVVTSYKLVDNSSDVAVTSTTVEKKDDNQSIVTVETSAVHDSNLDKSNSS